jgi:hypothetical protein
MIDRGSGDRMGEPGVMSSIREVAIWEEERIRQYKKNRVNNKEVHACNLVSAPLKGESTMSAICHNPDDVLTCGFILHCETMVRIRLYFSLL